jgi:hypothetical protein
MLPEIYCPYCGERVTLSEEEINDNMGQKFISDCEVCCNPIEFTLSKDQYGEIYIEARTSDGF